MLPQGDGTINHELPLPNSPAPEAPGDQVPSFQVLSKISWSKHERERKGNSSMPFLVVWASSTQPRATYDPTKRPWSCVVRHRCGEGTEMERWNDSWAGERGGSREGRVMKNGLM